MSGSSRALWRTILAASRTRSGVAREDPPNLRILIANISAPKGHCVAKVALIVRTQRTAHSTACELKLQLAKADAERITAKETKRLGGERRVAQKVKLSQIISRLSHSKQKKLLLLRETLEI